MEPQMPSKLQYKTWKSSISKIEAKNAKKKLNNRKRRHHVKNTQMWNFLLNCKPNSPIPKQKNKNHKEGDREKGMQILIEHTVEISAENRFSFAAAASLLEHNSFTGEPKYIHKVANNQYHQRHQKAPGEVKHHSRGECL